MAVPAAEVLGVVREAARCGVRALLVVSAGFSDSDEPEGARARRSCSRPCAPTGCGWSGPTRWASSTPRRASALHALIGRVAVRARGLALSSQSGALGLALLGHAAARGLGISSFVALGNRADVSTNDLLEYWADDERTAVVALYMESFGNPRRFSQVVAARVAAQADPRRQGRPRAASLDDAATDALFRQAGVLRVETHAGALRRRRAARAPAAAARAPGRRGDELGRARRGRRRCVRARAAWSSRAPGEATRARLAAALPGADRLGNPIDLGVRAPVADDLRGDRRAARRRARRRGARAARRAGRRRSGRAPAGARGRAARDASKPVARLRRRRRRRAAAAPASWRVPNYRFPEAAVRALALAADRRDLARRGRSARRPSSTASTSTPPGRWWRARATARSPMPMRAPCCRPSGSSPARPRGVRMVADPDLGPLIGAGDRVAPGSAHRRRRRTSSRPRRAGAARCRRAPGRAGRRGARAGGRRAATRCMVTLGSRAAAPAREDLVSKNAPMSRYDQLCAEHGGTCPSATTSPPTSATSTRATSRRWSGSASTARAATSPGASCRTSPTRRPTSCATTACERGERVAVVLPPTPETAAVFFGTWKNAGILLSMSVLYGDDGIAHRLRDSQPRVLVTDKANARALRSVARRRAARPRRRPARRRLDRVRDGRHGRRRPARSSTTRAAPPAWPRASSTPTATCSRTRSSSTATRSRTASASTAWGSGRGPPASRRCSGRGAWAPSRSSCSARAASTPRSSSTSSAATRSRTSSPRPRRCAR